jgi:hypothetical protein
MPMDEPNVIVSPNDTTISGPRSSSVSIATPPHFLRGIHLSACDVLALPDPPSPPRSSKLSRRRRRASLALQDSTNRNRVDTTTEEMQPEHSFPREESKRHRSRSMRRNKPNRLPPPGSSLLSSGKHVPSLTAAHQPSPTKKRRRHSLATVRSPAEAKTRAPLPDLAQKLAEIQSLVRAWTAPTAPSNTVEIASKVAAIADYPLDHRKGDVGSESQRLHNSQLLVERLGPQLRRLDQAKRSDQEMCANITECEAIKCKKTAHYRYSHITGRAVCADEYEQRYTIMLQEMQTAASRQWSHYFDQLRANGAKSSTPLVPSLAMCNANEGVVEKLEPVENGLESSSTFMDDPASPTTGELRDPLTMPLPAFHDNDEAIFAGDMALPLDLEETPPVEQQPEASPPLSSPRKVSACREDLIRPEVSILLRDHLHDVVAADDDDDDDPDIVQAEQDLWAKIDVALSEYSQQVVRIRQARQQPVLSPTVEA